MKGEYTEEYHALRMAVLHRDNFKCQWPGCQNRRKLQVHHIVARIEGGPDEPSNLVTMCSACHRRLHRWQGRLQRLLKDRLALGAC